MRRRRSNAIAMSSSMGWSSGWSRSKPTSGAAWTTSSPTAKPNAECSRRVSTSCRSGSSKRLHKHRTGCPRSNGEVSSRAVGANFRAEGFVLARANLTPTMSEMVELAQTVESERSKVESWRLHVLIEAGYPLPLAERLAHSEADLHTAVDLVHAGCTPETAAEILL